MAVALGTIIIYAKDMQKSAAFYSRYFGFQTSGIVDEGLIELKALDGGANILLHQAAKGVKLGQVGVKLSFHVFDVEAFKLQAASGGLEFGPTHQANGYAFANAKTQTRTPSVFPVGHFAAWQMVRPNLSLKRPRAARPQGDHCGISTETSGASCLLQFGEA